MFKHTVNIVLGPFICCILNNYMIMRLSDFHNSYKILSLYVLDLVNNIWFLLDRCFFEGNYFKLMVSINKLRNIKYYLPQRKHWHLIGIQYMYLHRSTTAKYKYNVKQYAYSQICSSFYIVYNANTDCISYLSINI